MNSFTQTFQGIWLELNLKEVVYLHYQYMFYTAGENWHISKDYFTWNFTLPHEFFIHFANANELPRFSINENVNVKGKRVRLVFYYADQGRVYILAENQFLAIRDKSLCFLTFIFYNTILNMHRLPYIPQSFDLGVKEGKGQGYEVGKKRKV